MIYWHRIPVMRLISILVVVLARLVASSSVPGRANEFAVIPSRSWFKNSPRLQPNDDFKPLWKNIDSPVSLLRGGESIDDSESSPDSGEDDEERYSRQVYTLGARAHQLVRSTTIYIDGPNTSGLVYECGKNLALSGVGHIVVLVDDGEEEEAYHNAALDDLGQAYERAARSELGHDEKEEIAKASESEILLEFLQRLNPSVGVSKMSRSDLNASGEIPGGVLLCVDRSQSTQLHLNAICRKHKMPFVAVETASVYGRTFCDFGPCFEVYDADGETPQVVPLDHMELLGNKILVHCVEGEKHDVSKGDEIQFQLSSGDSMAQTFPVVQVQSPERFIVGCTASEETSPEEIVQQVNSRAASFTRIKIPQEVAFLPLEIAMEKSKEDDSLFAPCDLDKSFDPIRKHALLSCFEAIQPFVRKHVRLPSSDDNAEFQSLARSSAAAKADLVDKEQWKQIVESFSSCCAAKFTPIQALFGAIGAQEALKAASGLYNPVRQFLLYDCDELMVSTSTEDSVADTCTSDVAPGQTYIFGQSLSEKVASNRLFIVGAGAIGCELLKNLAAMGAGIGKGCIVVTDMDTIERSNLSRQLLFRDSDIGNFKSKAAHDAVLRFNPAVQMEIHTSKVGDEEHGPFDDFFWSKGVDIVLNALDNVEARLYMDGQCVAHRKALIDAGTLGSKGNVQVVIPGQSESYGSSVDPPEPAIPVCTLKNFPYAISHTIQWGRDLFDGLFQRRPAQVNENAAPFSTMGVNGFAKQLVHKLGAEAALEAASELSEDFVGGTGSEDYNIESIRESSLRWAAETTKKLFHDSMQELLDQHPVDSVDEDGEPFWSGTRRVPKLLSYSASDLNDADQEMVNANLVDFVKNAARLRIETFLPQTAGTTESLVTTEDVTSALSNISWNIVDAEDEDETKDDVVASVTKSLNGAIPGPRHLNAVEFEKDDETNGHVALVTAASNLRALCYGIPPVDAMETRRVAGRIVPAMITTTAFVSALSCIELIKLLQKAPRQLHRNAFINLALPFFGFTMPLPAEEMEGLQGETYTLWDRIVVKEGKKSAVKGGMTLRRFLQRVTKKACSDPDSIDIATVAYGPYMVYANFLHEDDESMLDRPVWELLKEAIVSGDEFDDEFSRDEASNDAAPSVAIENLDRRAFLDLTVVVEEQETGDEVELPPVRFVKWNRL